MDNIKIKLLKNIFLYSSMAGLVSCGSGGSSSSNANTLEVNESASAGNIPIEQPGSRYAKYIWSGGSAIANQPGWYGELGVTSINNMPGARYAAVAQIDSSGNAWLFGGQGFSQSGGYGNLNDLWKYYNGQWTWINGLSSVNANNSKIGPSGRFGSSSWMDKSNNLWVFGGNGSDSSGGFGILNDLWKYQQASNTWILSSGNAATVNQMSNYAPNGMPGSRVSASSWKDQNGNFWMFGGNGYDQSKFGYLNDLWEMDPDPINGFSWKFIGGGKVVNSKGVYGNIGIASSTNLPGGRYGSTNWVDQSGNLWLFGGYGYDAKGNLGNLNDLWEFNIALKEWVWISGSDRVYQPGTYGLVGITSLSSIPGARVNGFGWVDKLGNFWLFGGIGYGNSASQYGYLNDIWKYSPANNSWTWMGGEYSVNISGSYGTLGNYQFGNSPGSRVQPVGWVDQIGNLWLFSGNGYDQSGQLGRLNDLWQINP